MNILHMSDTHGHFPVPLEEEDFDVIVHSGDMLPNRTYGNRQIEQAFQRYWLEENAPKMSPRYWLKPLLVTPGNHDFIDPTPILRDVGIDARLLCNGPLEVNGTRFYGHPWTPTFYDWNWMCGPTEMAKHLRPVVDLLRTGQIDVLVSHGPMYGILDINQDREHCGCQMLLDVMIKHRGTLKAMLHGHIHESSGTWNFGGMRVSNAALTQRIVSLPPRGAQ